MKNLLVLFILVYSCTLRGEQGEPGEATVVEIEGPQGEPGIQGPPGQEGSPGAQGLQGDHGSQGEVGPMGPIGSVGPQGPTGEPGAMGPQGPQGISGPEGPIGLTGSQGPRGETGSVGPEGSPGPQGKQGEPGTPGQRGEVGPVGPMGPVGLGGPQGIPGPEGPAGQRGEQGLQGDLGPTGPQGEQGPSGPMGPQGLEGPQGPPGEPPPISCPIGTNEIWADAFLSYCLQPVSDPPPSLTWPQCVRHCSEQGLSLVSFEKLIVSCIADPLLFPETSREEGRWYWFASAPDNAHDLVKRVRSRGSPGSTPCDDAINFCDLVIAYSESSEYFGCGLANFTVSDPLWEGELWESLPAYGCLCGTNPR